jgi:polyisoprenoid-binding protein YceI
MPSDTLLLERTLEGSKSRATRRRMTKTMKTSLLIVLGLTLAACEDPAAGKPKAEVGSAVTPKSAGSAAAKPSASGDSKPATAAAGSYELVAADSKFEFEGSKVSGKHTGGFKTFSGSATLASGAVEGGSVKVDIDVASMFSDDEKLTGHLKSPDFFDAEKFPKATFESTEIAKGGEGGSHTITGNLTLRGETKSIKFPATITVEGDNATVKAEFSINRKDFKMEYPGKKDDLIRDDVLIRLDLKLKKK